MHNTYSCDDPLPTWCKLTRYVLAFSRKAGFCSNRSTSEKRGRSNLLVTLPIPAPQSNALPDCTKAVGPCKQQKKSPLPTVNTRVNSPLLVGKGTSLKQLYLRMRDPQTRLASHPRCWGRSNDKLTSPTPPFMAYPPSNTVLHPRRTFQDAPVQNTTRYYPRPSCCTLRAPRTTIVNF